MGKRRKASRNFSREAFFSVARAGAAYSCSDPKWPHFVMTRWFDECADQGALRLFLRFCPREIILGCFQTGRKSQWAQAHFFVGRDGWRDAGASMPGVPAVESRVGAKVRGRSQGSTGTGWRAWFGTVGDAGSFQSGCHSEAK